MLECHVREAEDVAVEYMMFHTNSKEKTLLLSTEALITAELRTKYITDEENEGHNTIYLFVNLWYIEKLTIHIRNQFMKIIEKIYNWT